MKQHVFDEQVRLQDDYFGYVNNTWLAANPIPKTETAWGTFYVLRDQSWAAVDTIVTELSQTPRTKLGHDQQLLRNFFESALGYAKNSNHHYDTLRSFLGQITRVQSHEDLARVLGQLHRHGIAAFWAPYVSQDDKDSRNQVLRFYQSGLGLPNRDYYLDQTVRMKKIRSAYTVYYRDIKNMLPVKTMLGCRRKTRRVEQFIAEISWTDVALRDVEKNYTRYTLEKLSANMGSFGWGAYFDGLRWQQPTDNIVIDQESFVISCVEFMANNPLDDVKAYLRWCTVNAFVGWLSEATARRTFDFYGTVLSGQEEMKPLWKRAVLLADRLIIGESLGREYAARHFPESSKRAVTNLVEDIRQAYHTRIDRLDWMADTTKHRAHTKLDNIKVFVGYPSVWKDLSSLVFVKDDVVANILASRAFETDLDLRKIGHTPDDEEWEMNAHTVNAYNHPNRLEIVFPAAILQPPFYAPTASRAENLGGIGAVIGHEFTHGFDDQGCQFDEHGNVATWQSKAERKEFDTLARHIVRQADSFEVIPGVHLQGKLILGEAIADIGGLTLAVEALGNASELPELFVNFARCECGHVTKERTLELAKTDPHPPSKFRVNNVVNHVDEFYTTYTVTKTDKLYLPVTSRAKIW